MSGNPVGVDNTFRRKFDKEEYLERARQREEKEEARKGKDKGPPVQRQPLKHRDYEVDLESRLGKTQAGYYCSVCECVGKDSANYLDHINGKKHQRALGMSMCVERASLEQVQKMFESLKKRKDPSSFSEQAIMPKTKKPALRKGTIPDGDSEERYNPPASSTGPSRRKAPSKKAASTKSIWDELSDDELASFPSTGPSRQKAPSKKAASTKSIWDELSDDELASFPSTGPSRQKAPSKKAASTKSIWDELSDDELASFPSTGPSRQKAPSKKAASTKSIWDELSDDELASFPSTGPSRQKAPSKKAASRKSPWDELSDEELASFLLGIKEKGKEQSSKKRAAEPEFEEEECDEKSDEEMAETEEPTIDLMLITNDNYALLRHVNQYEKPNSSTDARFHTRFQQEVFTQLYSQHRQFADHKHVDWAHLNSLDKYEGAYRLFQAVGLHDIVALRCDYNEEIIRQFYATVHVSASFDHLIWMTGTQRYQAFKVDFERALRTYMGTQERIEDKEALRVPAWSQFYDQSVNFVPGKIGGLLSLPSLINRIINHTFFPKSGNFDAIRGHAWNIIDNIMHGRKFDVVDLIIREISSSKNDRVKRIYFAPYIMALILRVTQFRGGRPEVHKAYKPREGAPVPAAVPPPASDVPSQSPATPADQVSLSQILSVVMEIRDSQQKLEQNQQRLEEAQTETNNRIAALTKQIHTLERARYGRR